MEQTARESPWLPNILLPIRVFYQNTLTAFNSNGGYTCPGTGGMGL
jgi:hypothetical protein